MKFVGKMYRIHDSYVRGRIMRQDFVKWVELCLKSAKNRGIYDENYVKNQLMMMIFPLHENKSFLNFSLQWVMVPNR